MYVHYNHTLRSVRSCATVRVINKNSKAIISYSQKQINFDIGFDIDENSEMLKQYLWYFSYYDPLRSVNSMRTLRSCARVRGIDKNFKAIISKTLATLI